MTAHDHYDELIAAYALDALSVEDRRHVDAHLSTCESCRVTLQDLRRVAASVGGGVEQVEPPPSLRARTLAAATALPQSMSTSRPRVVASTAEPARRSWSWLASAASLVLAAGIGLYALSLSSQLQSTRSMLAEASDRVEALRRDLAAARVESARLVGTVNVLRSGDVFRVNLQGRGAASAAIGRAYVSASAGLVFSAEGLPNLTADRSYQLWVIPPGAAPVSAGVFSVDRSGNSLLSIELPQGVSAVAAVAVTEEPAGGSVRATTAPVLVGAAVNN